MLLLVNFGIPTRHGLVPYTVHNKYSIQRFLNAVTRVLQYRCSHFTDLVYFMFFFYFNSSEYYMISVFVGFSRLNAWIDL